MRRQRIDDGRARIAAVVDRHQRPRLRNRGCRPARPRRPPCSSALTSSTVVARSTSNTQSVSDALASGTRTAMAVQAARAARGRSRRSPWPSRSRSGSGFSPHERARRRSLCGGIDDDLGVGQAVDRGQAAVADAQPFVDAPSPPAPGSWWCTRPRSRCGARAGSKRSSFTPTTMSSTPGCLTGAVTTTRFDALVEVRLQHIPSCGTCRRPRSPRRSPTSRYRRSSLVAASPGCARPPITSASPSAWAAGPSGRARNRSSAGAPSVAASPAGSLTCTN